MDAFYPKPIGIKIVSEMIQSDAVTRSTIRLDELELEKKMPGLAANHRRIGSRDLPAEKKTGRMPRVRQDHAIEHMPPAQVPVANVVAGSSSSQNVPAFGEYAQKRSADLDSITDDPARSSPRRLTKRMRIASSDRVAQSEAVCLIATDRPTQTSSEVLTHMHSYGWKVVVVHDGQDALRLLQMRNWDAVLIDDDLPSYPGTACVGRFREWEHENRVNQQKNIFLVSDLDIPSPFDRNAIVQPPNGCDHVLRKPVVWSDLKRLLHRSSQEPSMSIIIGKK